MRALGAMAYTQDDVAFGMNVLMELYAAWPYNAGVDSGALNYSGFLGNYTEDDAGILGQAAKLMGNQSYTEDALSQFAQTVGMQPPTRADILQAFVDYAKAHALSHSIVDGISQAIHDAPGAIANLGSFVTSTPFLIFMGLSVTAIIALLYRSEVKAASRGIGEAYHDAKDGIIAAKEGLKGELKKPNPRRKKSANSSSFVHWEKSIKRDGDEFHLTVDEKVDGRFYWAAFQLIDETWRQVATGREDGFDAAKYAAEDHVSSL